jgi:hypothetical protein
VSAAGRVVIVLAQWVMTSQINICWPLLHKTAAADATNVCLRT